jgi:kynurenine formamidase
MGIADRTPPTVEEYEAYRERFCNWGRWGEEDQLGTLNHITEETRLEAVGLVREGRTVSCGRPLAVTPGPRNPKPAQFFMEIDPRGIAQDYIGVACHGFVDTHIDALCHVYSIDGQLYNGRSSSEVTSLGARTCSIEHWRDGITTRGVLYDIPRLRGVDYVTLDDPVQGWELEDAAKEQGVQSRTGDAVLVCCGREEYFAANSDAPNHMGSKPGLHPSVLEFLYEHNAALLGSDFDEAPDQGYPLFVPAPVHLIANPYMGLPTLWNVNLKGLAAACAELRRWEFLFMVAPLIVVGGTGSVVNPMAVL